MRTCDEELVPVIAHESEDCGDVRGGKDDSYNKHSPCLAEREGQTTKNVIN